VLAALALGFLLLGLWQLERRAEKEALFARFAEAPEMSIGQALAEEAQFARVVAPGRYDPNRHLLLDNRVWNGRAGVHVLTPFTLADGTTLLVNRGWLPLPADRRSLPEVPTDAGPRTLRARLVRPRPGSRDSAKRTCWSDRWPQLVTYLDLESAAAALGGPVLPWILLLDAGDDSGFADRQWRPAAMAPAVHGAYALQWLALLAATVVIWLALGLRRGRLAGSSQ
jgi:cytochrome oxidase assembly protein ShyY1